MNYRKKNDEVLYLGIVLDQKSIVYVFFFDFDNQNTNN